MQVSWGAQTRGCSRCAGGLRRATGGPAWHSCAGHPERRCHSTHGGLRCTWSTGRSRCCPSGSRAPQTPQGTLCSTAAAQGSHCLTPQVFASAGGSRGSALDVSHRASSALLSNPRSMTSWPAEAGKRLQASPVAAGPLHVSAGRVRRAPVHLAMMATFGCGTASSALGTCRQGCCIHQALVRLSTWPCTAATHNRMHGRQGLCSRPQKRLPGNLPGCRGSAIPHNLRP